MGELRSLRSLQHQERKALAELLRSLIGRSEPIVSHRTLMRILEQLENLGVVEMDVYDVGAISLLIDEACNNIKQALKLNNIHPLLP